MQGQLFNPDNPPLAFSKEEGNARLAQIRAELAARPGWIRHFHNVTPKSRIMDQFHDRRGEPGLTEV